MIKSICHDRSLLRYRSYLTDRKNDTRLVSNNVFQCHNLGIGAS